MKILNGRFFLSLYFRIVIFARIFKNCRILQNSFVMFLTFTSFVLVYRVIQARITTCHFSNSKYLSLMLKLNIIMKEFNRPSIAKKKEIA